MVPTPTRAVEIVLGERAACGIHSRRPMRREAGVTERAQAHDTIRVAVTFPVDEAAFDRIRSVDPRIEVLDLGAIAGRTPPDAETRERLVADIARAEIMLGPNRIPIEYFDSAIELEVVPVDQRGSRATRPRRVAPPRLHGDHGGGTRRRANRRVRGRDDGDAGEGAAPVCAPSAGASLGISIHGRAGGQDPRNRGTRRDRTRDGTEGASVRHAHPRLAAARAARRDRPGLRRARRQFRPRTTPLRI